MRFLCFGVCLLIVTACSAQREPQQLSDEDIRQIAIHLARASAAVSNAEKKRQVRATEAYVYVPAEISSALKMDFKGSELKGTAWFPVGTPTELGLKSGGTFHMNPETEKIIAERVNTNPLLSKAGAYGWKLLPDKAVVSSAEYLPAVGDFQVSSRALTPESESLSGEGTSEGIDLGRVTANLIQKLTALRDSVLSGPVRLTGFNVTLGSSTTVTANFSIMSK